MIVGLAMVKLETAIQESRPAAINDFFLAVIQSACRDASPDANSCHLPS